MSAASWDARYAERGWLHEPSSTVVDALDDLPPGRAVDLAAGPGRHARWLAGRGWQVTAVDFSAVGIEQGRAADAAGEVEWVVADAAEWAPDGPVDLVLAAYVQLGADGLRRAAGWLSPGGRLVVVGHALRNLVDGVHGPKDPAHLQTEEVLRAGAEGLVVERLEEVLRPDDGGTVVELLLVARRPRGPASAVLAAPALDAQRGDWQGHGEPTTRGAPVSDHVYSISEIVGSSAESVDDAIRKAVRSVASTKRNVEWFSTEEIRGHVVDGEVGHFQVTLKVGFRLDESQP